MEIKGSEWFPILNIFLGLKFGEYFKKMMTFMKCVVQKIIETLELMQKKLDKETLLLPKKLSTRVSNFIDLSASYQDRNLYWNSDPIHYYPSFGGVFFNKHIIPMINSNFESR